MKKIILILVAACTFLCAPLVSATILTYDITITGNPWGGTNPRAFGLPLDPGTLTAKLKVDNSKADPTGQADKSALVDFVFVTGPKTWTEEFDDRTTPVPTFFRFNASGLLTEFLVNLKDDPSFLLLASNDTMEASDDGRLRLTCNDCVDFSLAPAATAPLPGTLVLLLGACAAVGSFVRRRKSPQ